jgi:hypothetical protein
MSFISRFASTIRYAKEVRNFVLNPISVEQARSMLTRQLAAREDNFLLC